MTETDTVPFGAMTGWRRTIALIASVRNIVPKKLNPKSGGLTAGPFRPGYPAMSSFFGPRTAYAISS